MPNTAAQMAAWSLRDKFGRWFPPNTVAGSPPPQGPTDPIGLGCEIYLGGAGWTDITPYVLYRDSSQFVTINRGRPDEMSGTVSQPQTCAFQLNNRGAQFSPRNPTGPYYQAIGRNTPVRFWRMQNGLRRYRYHGEVVSWPTTADISGNDVWASMNAAGMLRRLSQGAPPSLSALYRAYVKANALPNVVAYWPCEDGQSSSSISSALPTGAPMAVVGAPAFASDSAFLCSQPIPVLGDSVWSAAVPGAGVSWTDNVLRFLMHIPSSGEADGAVVARFYTSGTVARVDLVYNAASNGTLSVKGYSAGATLLFTLGPLNFSGSGFNGLTQHASISLRASGANITYEFEGVQISYVSESSVSSSSATLTSASVGAVQTVVIDPNGNLSGTSIGHISVQNAWGSVSALTGALTAWRTDTAPGRLERLCSEEGVNQVSQYGDDPNEASLMGVQAPGAFLDLARECTDVDTGMLFEARDQLALQLRQRWTLYNEGTVYAPSPSVLTLDCAQNQLSAQLAPIDDDAYTRNDVTVVQSGGVSARAVLDDGSAMSISPPPLGVGGYETSYSLNIGPDDDFLTVRSSIADHAGWRLHLGTVDEARYPTVSINLRHPQFTGNLTLMNAALMVDIGDLIVIDNPPAWLPPDPIRLIIIGYSETMGVYEHGITFTCVPESPYRVFAADDWVLGRADIVGSSLAAPIGASDTAVSLATPAAPLWTASPADFPFDVGIGGERVTMLGPGVTLGRDPFLSSGLAHYSGQNGAITLDATRPFPTNADNVLNPYALQTILMVPTGGLSTDVLSDNSGAGTASPTVSYSVWGWVFSPTGRSFKAFANWADSGAGYLSTSFGSVTATTAGLWQFVTAAVTAPASTSQLSIGIADSGTPSAAQTFNVWGLNAAPASALSQASPQQYSVIRAVNGVSKSQSAGTDVRLWQPPILSL